MNIRPIRNEVHLDWALAEIEPYFETEPTPASADADRFEVLATLVEAYEAKTWSLPDADPIDVLKTAIADMGRTQADLAGVLGSRSHASEVLARRRPLSLDMIRRISAAWDLQVSLLVPKYALTDVA